MQDSIKDWSLEIEKCRYNISPDNLENFVYSLISEQNKKNNYVLSNEKKWDKKRSLHKELNEAGNEYVKNT